MSAITLSGYKRRLIEVVLSCLLCFAQQAYSDGLSCPAALHTADVIDHDMSVSFCELCDVGTVRLIIENPFRQSDDADFAGIVVSENLMTSGLTYVPGSTSFSGANL
ncbi:MAG: hypothetical protein O7E57_08625, partial [Gammaproteobacteria bacterium]|nr:hypothetical protein [Gammaproteobacteria bacterium]